LMKKKAIRSHFHSSKIDRDFLVIVGQTYFNCLTPCCTEVLP
jgi:hypothetical protein